MRRRPFLLVVCSLLFLYFPAEFLWRAAHGNVVDFPDILFSIVFPLILLVGLLRVAKFGWYSLIAFGALWGFRDIVFYYSSQGHSLAPVFAHLIIYALSLSYFINPRVRHIYFDPKLHWWRSKPRYETHCPAIVKVESQGFDYPVMRNISEGGCFIETPHVLGMNELLNLQIPLPQPLNVSVIQVTGEVRWVSGGALRPGMGILFKDMEPSVKRAVRSYVRKQL